MSSFNCEKCNTAIIDTPGNGYITHCEHYPKGNKESEVIKCERCGRYRELFQYTHFEHDKFIEMTKDNGSSADPRFTVERLNIAQSRGLCEECGVEINKKKYDNRE